LNQIRGMQLKINDSKQNKTKQLSIKRIRTKVKDKIDLKDKTKVWQKKKKRKVRSEEQGKLKVNHNSTINKCRIIVKMMIGPF